MPVRLEKGVKAAMSGATLKLEGPKGKLEIQIPEGFVPEISDSTIVIKRPGDSQRERSLHGLTRKLVANMAAGVSKGFTRTLEITGVGYRAEAKANQINLTLGYSHPIVYQLPPGVTAKVERQVVITIEGPDLQMLGTVAAQIRALRTPEPYKGKGIKYAGETIRRKAGKAAAGAAAI
jgi:large subunit ribosomal protein L6